VRLDRKKAVILLSGGLDSSTAAAIARADGFELCALTVAYGQRHAVEIEAARRVARALGVVRHMELTLDLAAFGGSALTGEGSVPKDRNVDEVGIPSTYVPGRNTVFLSLALAWAESLGASDIVIGVNALDYSGYPDCRPEFVEAFERMANLATRAGAEGTRFKVHTPLISMSKGDIIRRGLALGVDYGLTHSCYDPAPNGGPCGHCDSCVLRARGFAECGVPDPLLSPEMGSDLSSGGLRGRQVRPHSRSEDTAVTDRLYYTDASQIEFDAAVDACDTQDGRIVATLDRTAFYPTSGGQPFDTGTLGAASVIDVVDLPDGRIGHVLDRTLPPGSSVHGTVNWPRRFDHMQQHTGQHILSAAFDRLFKARTVGFHLGAAVSTLDLDKVLGAESIGKAEAETNRIVWENREVAIRFASAEEAVSIALRKEPTRSGRLRLIEVAGFDTSACGGTHVARAGEVGIVAVKSWEKFRGGMRLEFVCGGRALAEYGVARDAVAGCIRLISVGPGELPAAIERAQGENKDLRRLIRDLQERLAVFEAAAMVDRGRKVGSVTLVLEIAAGVDQAGLKTMAGSAASRGGVVAGLISATEPVLVVLARSPDVPVDASAILKTLLGQAGGKGGGKPELAQGGGMTGRPAEIRAALQTIIERVLQPSP